MARRRPIFNTMAGKFTNLAAVKISLFARYFTDLGLDCGSADRCGARKPSFQA
jgi:hypothetical protein